jgi:hypothetical protein
MIKIKQKKIFKSYLFVTVFLIYGIASAQQQGKLYFTTAFGSINPQGKFGKSVKSTLAFNSGVELSLKNNWFTQAVFDFNALKYDQQVRDNNSPFLFQNTNSSLLLLGLNSGKNIPFKNQKWFISLYGGGGYLNVGEPRVTVDQVSNIAKQNVTRESNVFARGGSRLAYKTKSDFFQTIYFDVSYWASPSIVQQGRVNGFSFYLGTRFGTVQ